MGIENGSDAKDIGAGEQQGHAPRQPKRTTSGKNYSGGDCIKEENTKWQYG